MIGRFYLFWKVYCIISRILSSSHSPTLAFNFVSWTGVQTVLLFLLCPSPVVKWLHSSTSLHNILMPPTFHINHGPDFESRLVPSKNSEVETTRCFIRIPVYNSPFLLAIVYVDGRNPNGER